MKYSVGQKVKIRSLEWYRDNINRYGIIECGKYEFFEPMNEYCGKVVTIKRIDDDNYRIDTDKGAFCWTDEMIEGLVEEEMSLNKAGQITDFEYEGLAYTLPEGYVFKDENSNIINATKIILEKKPDDKLKLESTKKVREYWSEYTRIFIEIYDDDPNECILTHLFTLEGHRQKGYAKKALAEAELIARELGCHKAYLKVETNSWMYNWYLRCGYNWYKNADEGYTWLTKSI